ncbi:MAG: hypothetical protein K0M50_06370 [Prolixibacteraceae bacterium]|nr:hypothetical protein [Prolixibacteraceae bacterium]
MKKSTEIKNGKNLVHPTKKPLTEQELTEEIRKAESAGFITVQEGMKDFEQWLQVKESR